MHRSLVVAAIVLAAVVGSPCLALQVTISSSGSHVAPGSTKSSSPSTGCGAVTFLVPSVRSPANSGSSTVSTRASRNQLR